MPLSSGFPASELRYSVDHSEALLLLSSAKFADKAAEVVKEGLEHTPISARVDKIEQSSQSNEKVKLEDVAEDKSGMMLYTSGTTSRPVRV